METNEESQTTTTKPLAPSSTNVRYESPLGTHKIIEEYDGEVQNDTATEHGDDNEDASRANWLKTLLAKLGLWLSTTNTAENSDSPVDANHCVVDPNDELWQDWEYILDHAERAATQASSDIASELELLRRTGTQLRFRKVFQQAAKDVFERFGQTTNASNFKLDASKRNSLVSTIVEEVKQSWFKRIAKRFFRRRSSSKESAPLLTIDFPTDSSKELGTNDLVVAPIETSTTTTTRAATTAAREEREGEEEEEEEKEEAGDVAIAVGGSSDESDLNVEALMAQGWWSLSGQDVSLETLALNDDSPSAPLSGTSVSSPRSSQEFDSELSATFRSEYFASPYSKNVVGSLKDSSFLATHGATPESPLTVAVLSDIAWSWWKTLARQLQEHRTLSDEDNKFLADLCVEQMPRVYELWAETSQNSAASQSNAGVLPAQWAKERKAEEERLLELKRQGKVDAKYGSKPQSPSPRAARKTTEHRQSIKQLRQFLEAHLTPPPNLTPPRTAPAKE